MEPRVPAERGERSGQFVTVIEGTSWQTLALDNFAYTAAAIPEPSTYAALLGVVSLTGALIRRRRLQRAA